MSKCNGDSVSSNWENEIVNFNPYPHQYNTLNLPSWESQDSPIPNNNRIASNCFYHKSYDDFNAANIPIINTMVIRSNGKWGIQDYLGPVIRETKGYKHGWLYYGGNALHWDNNGRGALNLYSDQRAGAQCAFQLGNVDTRWFTQRDKYRLDIVSRWMPAVYGFQFEWDTGIHFPGIDDHKHDDTNTSTNGYRIKSLIMHYTMTDNNGNVLSDFALTLVKNSLIPPGICYWHEGYSLVDTISWKDTAKGQGYSSEGQPMRRGKCGFAIDSNALGFELIRNCAVTQDGKRYHYIKNYEDASNLKNNRIDELGAQMIWRSTYFAFEGSGSDSTAKKKNFRMWNCKPITVPVTYADPSKTHCHGWFPTDGDEWDTEEDKRYQPYKHRDVAVIHDTTKGGPQSANMKEVVPGLGDIEKGVLAANGYKYLYTSKELRKRRDEGDLHPALEAEIRGRSSLPLTGKPAEGSEGFDENRANYQNQGIPKAGETGFKDS